jgi:hypothetical protein
MHRGGKPCVNPTTESTLPPPNGPWTGTQPAALQLTVRCVVPLTSELLGPPVVALLAFYDSTTGTYRATLMYNYETPTFINSIFDRWWFTPNLLGYEVQFQGTNNYAALSPTPVGLISTMIDVEHEMAWVPDPLGSYNGPPIRITGPLAAVVAPD